MNAAKVGLWMLCAAWAGPGHSATGGFDLQLVGPGCTAAVTLGQVRVARADHASRARDKVSDLEEYLEMHAQALERVGTATAPARADLRAQAGRSASNSH